MPVSSTDKLSVLLTGTFYGKQEPATANINNDPRCTGSCDPSIALQDRGAYNIWGVSARYRVTGTVSFGFGVNNLADKRLFREANSSDAGAATYNEPGRAYWASLRFGF